MLTVINGKASGATPFKLVWPDSKLANEVDCLWDPNNNTIPQPSRIACDGETFQLAMRADEVDDQYDRPLVVASGDGIWYMDCKRARLPLGLSGANSVSPDDTGATVASTNAEDERREPNPSGGTSDGTPAEGGSKSAEALIEEQSYTLRSAPRNFFDAVVSTIQPCEKALLGKWWITGIDRSGGVKPGVNVLGDGRGRAELTFHADGRLQFLRSDGKTKSWRYGMDDANLIFISGDDELEAPFTRVFKWAKLPEGHVMLILPAIDGKSTRREFLLQRLEEPHESKPPSQSYGKNDSLPPGDIRSITKKRLVGEWRAINEHDTWLSFTPDGTYKTENRKPDTSHTAMKGRWRLDGRKLNTSIEGDNVPSRTSIGTSNSICALDDRRLVIRILSIHHRHKRAHRFAQVGEAT